jgi:DNA end-binding protein Ku
MADWWLQTDPEMVTLATQLIDRQTTTYDPLDTEDRYETRLRALIDAKLKGEGVEDEAHAEPDRGNVVDLMAALRKSLGQGPKEGAAPVKVCKAIP